MSESTTRQPRWPAGTPVAPSGRGPAGLMTGPELIAAVAAGRAFEVSDLVGGWRPVYHIEGQDIYYSREAIQDARRRIERIKSELDPEIWAGVDAALTVLRDISGETGRDL